MVVQPINPAQVKPGFPTPSECWLCLPCVHLLLVDPDCPYRPLEPFLTAARRNYHAWLQTTPPTDSVTVLEVRVWGGSYKDSNIDVYVLYGGSRGESVPCFFQKLELSVLLGSRLHLSEFCLIWCISFCHNDPSASLLKGPLWWPWTHLNNPR